MINGSKPQKMRLLAVKLDGARRGIQAFCPDLAEIIGEAAEVIEEAS